MSDAIEELRASLEEMARKIDENNRQIVALASRIDFLLSRQLGLKASDADTHEGV